SWQTGRQTLDSRRWFKLAERLPGEIEEPGVSRLPCHAPKTGLRGAARPASSRSDDTEARSSSRVLTARQAVLWAQRLKTTPRFCVGRAGASACPSRTWR